MAITAYTGPPGAGKSYAMVSQALLEGVRAGRRVLTNIDGVKPDAVLHYLIERGADPDELGEVVKFHGAQAKEPGFWPTEQSGDAETFVKGGDLVIFDEFKLYFPRRGKLPLTPKPTDEDPSPISPIEGFLRYHRHMTRNIRGQDVACDVVIGTQLASDVNDNIRGLIESSFKFKKLSAVGLNKAFLWDVYDGHLQPKGGRYDKGNGTYKKEIFELYSSYQGGKAATELRTDSRRSIWGKSIVAMVAGCFALLAFGIWGVLGFFMGGAEAAPVAAGVTDRAAVQVAGAPAPLPASSTWRISGFIRGDSGVSVILSGPNGLVRAVRPDGFDFRGDRPVAGWVDGQRVFAEDRLGASAQPAPSLISPAFAQ